MKKGRIWMMLASAFALCLALVACGASGTDNTANFAGVWEVSSMSENDQEVDSAELDTMKAFGLNIYLVLNEDGTGELNLYGLSVGLSWKATSATAATITFVDADAAEAGSEFTGEVPLTLADGKLTIAQNGTSMTFAKTTQEAMDEFLAAGGGLGNLDFSEMISDGSATAVADTSDGADWTGELADTYADSTYGFSFMAPDGASATTEEGKMSLYWGGDHEMWVNAYVSEGEADVATMDEIAAYLEEDYEATIETKTDDSIIARSTDADGDTNYTRVIRSGSNDYYIDVYYHPADEGEMWEVAQAIMMSFTA